MNPRRPPTISEHEWQIAQQLCTAGELIALELDARGLSQRTIAIHLGVTRTTIRDRVRNAKEKIRRHLEETAA